MKFKLAAGALVLGVIGTLALCLLLNRQPEVEESPENKQNSIGCVRDPEAAEGEEVVMVQISVLDGEGNRCAAGHEEVHVQVAGQAELLGLENGKPDDLTPYRASYRSAYDGELTAYVRVLKGAENVRIFAWTESGLAGEVEL